MFCNVIWFHTTARTARVNNCKGKSLKTPKIGDENIGAYIQ